MKLTLVGAIWLRINSGPLVSLLANSINNTYREGAVRSREAMNTAE